MLKQLCNSSGAEIHLEKGAIQIIMTHFCIKNFSKIRGFSLLVFTYSSMPSYANYFQMTSVL